MSRSWSVFLVALTLLFGGAAYGATNEKLDRLIELLTEFRGAIDEGEFERAREMLREIEALDPELSCLVDVFPVVSRSEDSVAVEAEEIELGGVEGPLAGAYEVEVSGQPPRDSDAVARAEIRLVAAASPGAGESRRSTRRGSHDETPDRAGEGVKDDVRDEASESEESEEANLDEGEVRIVTEDGEVVEREPLRGRVRSNIARPGRYRVEFVWRAQVVLEFWVTVVARIELDIDAAEVIEVLPSGSANEDTDGTHVVVGDAPRMPQSKLAEWFERYAEERLDAGLPRPTLVGSKVLVPVEWKGTGSLPPVLDRSLRGRVYDLEKNELAGVVIRLQDRQGGEPIEIRSDEVGGYEFEGLLPGV